LPYYYKLTLEYDGTHYHGFQKQPHHTTIQEQIENALFRLTQETVKIIGAGRTDAGVHAMGQVVNFKLDKTMEHATLLHGLNALLPDDIAVKKVASVHADFHARYGARRKTYRYFIHNSAIRSPWKEKIAWQCRSPLNIAKMRQAAKRLIGIHDFSSFCATDNDAKNHLVHFLKIAISKKEDGIQITLTANRFLRYMVRNIVGLLVEIGRGKKEVNIGRILDGKNRTLAGMTAPPQGLFLMEVRY